MINISLAAESEILRPRLQMLIGEIPHVKIVGDILNEQQLEQVMKLHEADILIIFFPKLGQSARRLVSVARLANPGAIVVALTTGFDDVNEEAWRHAGATYTFNLTTQLQQFIDCLSTYARTGLVRDRRATNDGLLGNEQNT
jgi:hypothetical protein